MTLKPWSVYIDYTNKKNKRKVLRIGKYENYEQVKEAQDFCKDEGGHAALAVYTSPLFKIKEILSKGEGDESKRSDKDPA